MNQFPVETRANCFDAVPLYKWMMVPYEFADITPNFNGKPLKLVTAYIQESWQDSSQVKLISGESYQQIN